MANQADIPGIEALQGNDDVLVVVDWKLRRFAGSFVYVESLLNRVYNSSTDPVLRYFLSTEAEVKFVRKPAPFGRYHAQPVVVLQGWEQDTSASYCSGRGRRSLYDLDDDGGKYVQLWAQPVVLDPTTWYPIGPLGVLGPGTSGSLCY